VHPALGLEISILQPIACPWDSDRSQTVGRRDETHLPAPYTCVA